MIRKKPGVRVQASDIIPSPPQNLAFRRERSEPEEIRCCSH